MRVLNKASLFSSVACLSLFGSVALAEPTGGVIVEGTGTVNPQQGQTTRIDQSSDRLIIEWQDFDVASNERVQFNQPSTDAIALNRVLSGAPSTIAGQIIANGRVFLINADGIIFTSTANIDVNSLLATTNDIANADFLADNFDFSAPGAPGASIINQGSINAAEAGLIAFVAPNVENSGLLRANAGRIALASGEAFTLDFFGDDLITFAVATDEGDKTGSVTNSGIIDAPEGTIILTATAARDFINTVINVESDLVADSASMVGGRIILSGAENSAISVNADINATGRDGGVIDIEGGEIIVGGNARLLADGDQGMGNGGAIRVNSFERTEFAGLASATPGVNAGTGGAITIASDGVLIFTGIADAGPADRGGTVSLSAGGAGQDGGAAGGGDTTSGGGGSDGGGASGGGTTVGGGGTPVVILPPAARARAADALSEIASTAPVIPSDPAIPGLPEQKGAIVLFDDSLAFDLGPTGESRNKNPEAELMCLHGVADEACRK